QTVDEATHPRFAALLEAFDRQTGCPMLLNTSFNLNDEPIVCTPTDALHCFLRSTIDTLILEAFVIDRAALGPSAALLFLLGESVARGFFYDPIFNPAIALRAMFATAAPGRPIEVVDLARTDQLLAPLQRLVEAAVALEPDVMVVFAGNNWHPAISFDRRD